MYFVHILYPLPTLSRSSFISTWCSFSSRKKKKEKKNRLTNKTKQNSKTKNTKTKTKSTWKYMESVCVGQVHLGMESVLECGWETQRLFGENGFSFSQWVSYANSFLVMGGALCLPPLLCAGIVSGLNLCRPRTCCHTLWVHTCISLAVSGRCCFLRPMHHLWLYDKNTPLHPSSPKSLTLHTLSSGWYCYRPQETASLMRVDWCTDLLIQRYVIRSYFIARFI